MDGQHPRQPVPARDAFGEHGCGAPQAMHMQQVDLVRPDQAFQRCRAALRVPPAAAHREQRVREHRQPVIGRLGFNRPCRVDADPFAVRLLPGGQRAHRGGDARVHAAEVFGDVQHPHGSRTTLQQFQQAARDHATVEDRAPSGCDRERRIAALVPFARVIDERAMYLAGAKTGCDGA